jgi:hypothetical protein
MKIKSNYLTRHTFCHNKILFNLLHIIVSLTILLYKVIHEQ